MLGVSLVGRASNQLGTNTDQRGGCGRGAPRGGGGKERRSRTDDARPLHRAARSGRLHRHQAASVAPAVTQGLPGCATSPLRPGSGSDPQAPRPGESARTCGGGDEPPSQSQKMGRFQDGFFAECGAGLVGQAETRLCPAR